MRKTKIDFTAAYELKLYADNDRRVYFNILVPVYKNMDKKRTKGIFDKEKALLAFCHVADYAAQLYCKEFGGIWHIVFNKATREETARLLLDDYLFEKSI